MVAHLALLNAKDQLLRGDDIINNALTFNKYRLTAIHQIINNTTDFIGQDFLNNFKRGVNQVDRIKVP